MADRPSYRETLMALADAIYEQAPHVYRETEQGSGLYRKVPIAFANEACPNVSLNDLLGTVLSCWKEEAAHNHAGYGVAVYELMSFECSNEGLYRLQIRENRGNFSRIGQVVGSLGEIIMRRNDDGEWTVTEEIDGKAQRLVVNQ